MGGVVVVGDKEGSAQLFSRVARSVLFLLLSPECWEGNTTHSRCQMPKSLEIALLYKVTSDSPRLAL